MSQLQKLIKQPKGETGTTAYYPKGGDEQAFVDKHEIQMTDDANGNGDEIFKGKVVKKIDRSAERHGYDSPTDQKVHEETVVEMSSKMKSKRHEISLALKRENPSWPLTKVFAIATSAAQKAVKEEIEEEKEVNDLSLLELYISLDDENRLILSQMVDEGLDSIIADFIKETKNA